MPITDRERHHSIVLNPQISSYIIADYSQQTIPIIDLFSPDMYRATVSCIAAATRIFGRITETQSPILYSAMYRHANTSDKESWLSYGVETGRLLSIYVTLLIEAFQNVPSKHWNGLLPVVVMTEPGFVTHNDIKDIRQVYVSYFNDNMVSDPIYLFGAICNTPGTHEFYTDNFAPDFYSPEHLSIAQDNCEVQSYYPQFHS